MSTSITLTVEQARQIKEYIAVASEAGHDLEALGVMVDAFGKSQEAEGAAVATARYLSKELERISSALYEAPMLPEGGAS